MPRKKVPCPECGQPKGATAKTCRRCAQPYERTDQHRESMSRALRGKRHSYRSASTRPEVAEKIRQAWTQEKREAARERGLRLAEDQAWRDLIARSVTGELNPRYRGQDAASGYAPGWGRRHKELIRERAGHRCEHCGRQPERTLDIHHKDWTKTNHHPSNLEALCRSCHKVAHPGSRNGE